MTHYDAEPGGHSMDPAISAAWSHEIERRIAAYDRGETIAIDFDVALQQMYEALAAHRASRKSDMIT